MDKNKKMRIDSDQYTSITRISLPFNILQFYLWKYPETKKNVLRSSIFLFLFVNANIIYPET